jgi:hypothetical protein
MLNISAVDAFCCCVAKGEVCCVVFEVALDEPNNPANSSAAPPCAAGCVVLAASSSIRSISALLGASPPLYNHDQLHSVAREYARKTHANSSGMGFAPAS